MAVQYIWYDNLYFDEENAKKKARLLRRLEKGKPEPNVYVLALPDSRDRNILDIFNSLELMQPHYKGRKKYIVGIARSKQAAVELAADIVGEMYGASGGFDLRAYLEFNETPDDDKVFSDKEV
ncbi:putative uncharacterized protein [Firmicutes bacterium CAG:882]|jgi:hypothetical protein|nr:putative uncharacterized protein [Firmicutes bacterium CAG:882]